MDVFSSSKTLLSLLNVLADAAVALSWLVCLRLSPAPVGRHVVVLCASLLLNWTWYCTVSCVVRCGTTCDGDWVPTKWATKEALPCLGLFPAPFGRHDAVLCASLLLNWCCTGSCVVCCGTCDGDWVPTKRATKEALPCLGLFPAPFG